MNVLFIIGNGFDLRLGLPTRYSDFLSFYKTNKPLHYTQVEASKKEVEVSKNRFFEIMDEKEQQGQTEWRDLEVALGEFTSSFSSKEKFKMFYTDINRSLIAYLSAIEKGLSSAFTQEQADHLKQSLIAPYTYLNNRELNRFRSRLGNDYINAKIISFNYTSSIEMLCGETIVIGSAYSIPDSSYFFELRDIKHIHGFLSEEQILLGVDNEEQILNKQFRQDEDILDILVKPRGNKNIGSLVDEECLQIIKEATVIYIFGTSLGKTDQTWWTAIKESFLQNQQTTILYFLYEPSSTPILKMDASPQRAARQKIVSALGLDGTEEDYRDRIFIALNTDMFPHGKALSSDKVTL